MQSRIRFRLLSSYGGVWPLQNLPCSKKDQVLCKAQLYSTAVLRRVSQLSPPQYTILAFKLAKASPVPRPDLFVTDPQASMNFLCCPPTVLGSSDWVLPVSNDPWRSLEPHVLSIPSAHVAVLATETHRGPRNLPCENRRLRKR